MLIQPLQLHEIDDYISHIVRGFGEVDRGETPAFSTYTSVEEWAPDEKREIILAKLQKPLTEPGWKRAWTVHDSNLIVGRIELGGLNDNHSFDKASLSMAVEAKYRNQGVGRSLIETAISWAKGTDLVWIELHVFAHNTPAITLYRKLGFVEIGKTADLVRIGDVNISDLTMALRIR